MMDNRQLNSHTLYVTLVKGAQYALVGFPFIDAYDDEIQYIDREDFDDDGHPVVEINLGYRKDTTFAQEQFLDTSDQVLRYEVSPNIEPGA